MSELQGMQLRVPTRTIKINTRYNTQAGGGIYSVYTRSTPITTSVSKKMAIALINATIPLSVYAINANNNAIRVTEVSGVTTYNYTFTIPVGNYDAATFVSTLNSTWTSASAASGATVAYAVTLPLSTGKLRFAMSTASVTTTLQVTNPAFTAQEVLGLSSTPVTPYTFTSVAPLIAPYEISIAGPKELIIRFREASCQTYETRVSNESAILAVISVTAPLFSNQVYQPLVVQQYAYINTNLDQMTFQITDENGTTLDFGNAPINMQLGLYEL